MKVDADSVVNVLIATFDECRGGLGSEWDRLGEEGREKIRERWLHIVKNINPSAFSTNPTPMLLWCPSCGARHVDKKEFATKPHHTHACQSCGMVWRPALEATVGVQFLPGFKDAPND